jgi:hypothetical protein
LIAIRSDLAIPDEALLISRFCYEPATDDPIEKADRLSAKE